ncbi:hypothetical protein WOLCODRAFT_138288 [Wolfiporia cocos MD-104 SS10]|uniref:Uncharacterized protein n=1 Tax=Wolfiporia cocos (strain MD-104) TaxID=742152 RepID=A0A2H3JP82_WOLCO|nr:hypothetical protein WOLCODRAFT_138288 [Wolfiporia cocos MD-104 SS10]
MTMDWEVATYSFAEYIPGFGTLYSFEHSTNAPRVNDGRDAWVAGINLLGGVARKLSLAFAPADPLPVVVAAALAAGIPARAAQLLVHSLVVHVEHTFADAQPRADADHVNVLVVGRTRAECDAVVRQRLNAPARNDFLGVVRFHGALYLGPFTHEPYSTNDTFTLSFPAGMYQDAPCYIVTTFSKDYWGNKRALTSILPRVHLLKEQNKFIVKADATCSGYFWFECTVLDQGAKIELKMHQPTKVAATITVVRQIDNIT